jgi:hypothetical protein
MSSTESELSTVDALVRSIVLSRPEGSEDEVTDDLLFELAGVPQGIELLAGALERLFEAMLSIVWNKGWQPNDIRHCVGRRGTKELRRFLEFGLAHQARSCIDQPDTFVHPIWRQQLDLEAAPERQGCNYLQEITRSVSIDMFRAVPIIVRCIHKMRNLGSLPQFLPPPGSAPQAADLREVPPSGDKTLDRVRALLAKAESTEFAQEAESLTGKAQELITRHSIDIAMVYADGDAAGGTAPSGKRLHLDDPYVKEKSTLLHVVAGANGCRTVLIEDLALVTIFGFAADIEVVELLFTSLLVQATSAMTKASQGPGSYSDASFRRAFLIGYAHRINERLESARAAAVGEAEEDLGTSVDLVLAGRNEQVDALVKNTFGKLKATRSRRVDAAGFTAGDAAAAKADLGTRRRLRS